MVQSLERDRLIGGVLIQLKSEIEMRIVKHNAYWITKYYFEKDSKDFK